MNCNVILKCKFELSYFKIDLIGAVTYTLSFVKNTDVLVFVHLLIEYVPLNEQ